MREENQFLEHFKAFVAERAQWPPAASAEPQFLQEPSRWGDVGAAVLRVLHLSTTAWGDGKTIEHICMAAPPSLNEPPCRGGTSIFIQERKAGGGEQWPCHLPVRHRANKAAAAQSRL